MSDFQTAEQQYRVALAHHLELLQRKRIDNAYRQSGRAARRALRRCFRIAARHRIIWTPGDCRTFY